MELAQVATSFHDLTFDHYNAVAATWSVNQSTGRLAPVDRFQTLYSAPLHLRTASFPAGITLPASRVMRVNGMEEVYLCGQPRDDVNGQGSYGVLCNMRLVSGNAGGLYQVHRKATQGTSPDLGPLVDEVVATYYGDSQLFSIKKEHDLVNTTVGDFHVIFSATADVREWDFLEAQSGKFYRVLETYFDSGFLLCRAHQTVDTRVDVAYKVNTITTFVPGSGNKPTTNATAYVITGYFENYTTKDADASGVTSEFQLYVEAQNIGFIPSKKGLISYEGREHGIVSVRHDAAKRQWCFQCRL